MLQNEVLSLNQVYLTTHRSKIAFVAEQLLFMLAYYWFFGPFVSKWFRMNNQMCPNKVIFFKLNKIGSRDLEVIFRGLSLKTLFFRF